MFSHLFCSLNSIFSCHLVNKSIDQSQCGSPKTYANSVEKFTNICWHCLTVNFSTTFQLMQADNVDVSLAARKTVWHSSTSHNYSSTASQGCPQHVQSQDRESQPSTQRRWTLKTEKRPRHSIFPNLKTEMRRDVQPSRLRWAETFQKKRLDTIVSQYKNTNWWSLSLDNLFLAGQIHYFFPDISASLMHCMDVHKT